MKPSKKELDHLLKTMNNKEISSLLNINVRTLLRWKNEYGIKKYLGEISSRQNDILIATLLSTGKLVIKNNKEYLTWAQQELSPITTKLKKNLVIYYKKETKFSMNNFVLANWIAQSGTSKKNFITLPVRYFKLEEIHCHIKDFSTIKNKKIIIEKNSIFDNIKNYFVWESLKDKIEPKENSFNRLNKDKAKTIRKMFYEDDISAVSLAELYKVSPSSIYNILNNTSYQEKNIADISVIYNL